MKKLSEDFNLIETMLWENNEFFLLDLHMARLQKSARHFSFACNTKKIAKALKILIPPFKSSKEYRVRLVLEKSGKFSLTYNVLDPAGTLPVKITVSDKKFNENDIFLAHKTTKRELYDKELKRYRKKGFFDVIFENEKNEITEGAITNVIIQKDGNYWTPPVSCGLLPGVYREYLLASGEIPLKEKVLYERDLFNADRIFITNSVRKMAQAIVF